MLLLVILVIILAYSTEDNPVQESPPELTEEEMPPYVPPIKTYPKGTRFKWPSTQKEIVDYNTYISSLEWSQSDARKETLLNDNHQCRMCGSTDRIAVHHTHYRNLGKELTEDLCTLCHQCHEHTHEMAGKGALDYPPIRKP